MKVKSIVSIIFLVLLLFSSCSNSNDQESRFRLNNEQRTFKSEAFTKLNIQLEGYNRQFGVQSFAAPQTRGFLSKLWKVVKADLWGALAGAGGIGVLGVKDGYNSNTGNAMLYAGIIGAIVGSLDAVGTITSSNQTSCQAICDNNALVIGTSTISQSDSVGYFHNVIINEMLTEIPDLLTKDETEILNLTKAKIQNSFNLSSKEMEDIVNMGNVATVDIGDFDALKLAFPQFSDEIEITRIYFEGVSNMSTSAEVQTYTEGFRDIVVSSDIPEESMSVIQTSASVATNSYCLWQIEE